MVALKIEEFGGMIPIVDDYLLKNNNASYAAGAWLLNGRIAPVAAVVPVHTLADPNAQYAYRLPLVNESVANIPDSHWMEFENPNTVVVKTPVTGQDDPRYYWTNGQDPPGYNTTSRILAGDPPYALGIPAPEVAPGVTTSGGTTPIETRSYVYTWLSDLDEEGQPSLPTVVSGPIDATWHITMTAPTPGDMLERNLTKVRIYRTVTSSQGIASYYFVVELPITDLSYDDTIPDDTVALNNQLTSADYEMPPTDLAGMVAMPNGIMIGWRIAQNEIWFSEPYLPHAWPSKYMLAIEANVVGVGVWGQSAVVLCSGPTYVATGVTPDSMTLTKIPPLEPCGCKGSIVSTPTGVTYASQNGLIEITPYGGANVTIKMIDKSQFPKMVRVDNVHAAWLLNGWFGMGGVADPVFQNSTVGGDAFTAFEQDAFQQQDYTQAYNAVWINYTDPRVGVVFFPSDDPVFNVITDTWTAEVFIIRDGQVEWINFQEDYPRSEYLWRSKEFQVLYKQNWGAARIFCYAPPGQPVDGPTTFRFYADGHLKFEEQIQYSGQTFRMPSGYKSDSVQFELQGYLEILNVQVGQSVRDLRQV